MINYAKVDDFYKYLNRYEEYDELISPEKLRGDLKDFQNLFAIDFILKNYPKGGNLLEIGGGDCKMLSALLKKHPKKYKCWSLDPLLGEGGGISLDDIFLQNNINPKIQLITKEIGDFSEEVPNNFFDCVFSISVLEHIPFELWVKSFKDMRRSLKDQGGKTFHCIDVPVDSEISKKRYELINNIENKKVDFKKYNNINIPIDFSLKDPQTYFVSPMAYFGWLKYINKNQDSGEKNRAYARITSINCAFNAC